MKTILAAAALAVVFATTNTQAEESTGPRRLLTIPSTREYPRNSEGDIIQLKDGRLALVYSRFHGGSDDASAADLAIRTSSDRGTSWTPDRILLPNEGARNVMSVSLRRTPAGHILLFYLRKDTEGSQCTMFVRKSTDELETVGPPKRVTLLDGYHVVNNDRIVQHSSGRLLVPAALHTDLVTTSERRFNPKAMMVVYYSDDQGETWARMESPVIPLRDRVLTMQEPGIVEFGSGELLMYIRTDKGFQYGSVSEDRGSTWSAPRALSLASPLSPATIERIPGTTNLVCVWNDHSGRHPFKPELRNPLAVAISKDNGASWAPSKVLENEPGMMYCYTSITFVDDRMLLSYLRAKRGGLVADLFVTSVPVSWLCD